MSVIERLRRTIGAIDRRALVATGAAAARGRVLPVGFAPCDTALGGGLMHGALHELAAESPRDCGAASGFVTALAARAQALSIGSGPEKAREQKQSENSTQPDDGGLCSSRNGPSAPALWIQARSAMREQGRLYGAGLQGAKIAPHALLAVRVPRSADVLWAMEEALTLGLPLVIGELMRPEPATLTATRRLSLAAQQGGGLALLLQHRPSPLPSAALTRWRIAATASRPDAYGGLGLPAFTVSLLKNRHGACGRWLMHWHIHDRLFLAPEQLDALLARPPLPRGLLPASHDRPGGAQREPRPGAAIGRYRLAS